MPPLNSATQLTEYQSTALLLLDSSNEVRWMNAAAESLLAASRNYAAGKSLAHLAGMPERFWQHLDDARQNRQTLIDREVSIATRDAKSLLLDCIITPLPDSTNLLLEIFDNDRQIRIAQEQALLRQQQQTQTMLQSLAHEILNPLGGIRGAAQLLDQEMEPLPNEAELREYTGVMIREADRLQGLLRRLLGPRTRLQMQAENIHDIIEHVVQLLLRTSQTSIRYRPDYDPSIPDVVCDREQMIQVVINVISNAITVLQHSDQSQITVRTRVERNFTIREQLFKLVCKILIIDNGPGVPDDIRETLFYPLVSRSEDGSGLGLSIAQSLVVQQGGLIDCHSEPGNTTFEITLPIADGATT